MRNIIAFMVSCMAMFSCASEQNMFAVNQVDFLLSDNRGHCQLSVPKMNMTFDLGIPWPCQAHRTENGLVRVHEQQKNLYFLIESSKPHPELPTDCITQIQGVMLYQTTVKLSDFSDTVASCPPFRWDEKMFTGLFQ